MKEAMQNALDKRRDEGTLRSLRLSGGEKDFWSNDYLGLARTTRYSADEPLGSGGSRLISGHFPIHEQAEQFIAGFHGAEAALMFNSGYMANVGLLSCIADKHAVFLYDELCHASIIDGMRLSPAARRKFRHNDLQGLEQLLQRHQGLNCFVVSESVFSMDGDRADLPGLANLCARYGAHLIIDEAHALGVYPDAEGGLCAAEIEGYAVFARIYTYGKAMGLHGAAVVGSELLKQFLINFSRPFIYTTAPSPVLMSELLHNYQHLSETAERERLWKNIRVFHQLVDDLDLVNQVTRNHSAIQVAMKGHPNLKPAADELQGLGFQIKAILSPTVPAGTERLRICLHAYNEAEDIRQLLSIIKTHIIS